MTVRLSNTVRTTRVDAIRAAIDGGAGPGRMKIWSGVKPAKGSPPAGTLLADLVLSDPCGVSAAGVLTITVPLEDTSADQSGTASFFILEDSVGTFVLDGDCGESGSGADLIMSTVTVVAGQPVEVTTLTITDGSN